MMRQRWGSALVWRTFVTTSDVAIVLRAFIEYSSTGKCGLFGEYCSPYRLELSLAEEHLPNTLRQALIYKTWSLIKHRIHTKIQRHTGEIEEMVMDTGFTIRLLFVLQRLECLAMPCLFESGIRLELLYRMLMLIVYQYVKSKLLCC
ncbi:chloride channel protein CLC-a-like isoform X1 [Euphorbia lathyris]|uniref:chloride channel protein CLC-a-like isoform X1 n=1 Tax=Euphorbia lathyris TaxID=212925 RepID=UPI0033138E46